MFQVSDSEGLHEPDSGDARAPSITEAGRSVCSWPAWSIEHIPGQQGYYIEKPCLEKPKRKERRKKKVV